MFVPRKPRRTIRKFKLSHPNAHLAPDFLLKKAQCQSKCKTRSDSGDLDPGMSHASPARKPRLEEYSPSSGDSSATQLPVFNVNRGDYRAKAIVSRHAVGSTSGATSQDVPNPLPERAATEVDPSGENNPDTMKQFKEEMKLKAEADLTAACFEESARQAQDRLEQAVKVFEEEKASLLKCAEKAECKLGHLKENYGTLVKQINEMLAAIFGRKEHTLVELPILKLKAILTYVEQLFTGSFYSIMAIKNLKYPPIIIKDMLKQLSTVPQWVTETQKSVARSGANMALTRAKTYLRELDLEALKDGFPEYKLDGSEFTHDDFAKCFKETRPLATLIAEEIKLVKYHHACSNENERINAPKDELSELVPP